MARINLLPWREAERKRRQREFAMIHATSLGATVLLGFSAHLQIDRLISRQQDRNSYLRSEIGELNEQRCPVTKRKESNVIKPIPHRQCIGNGDGERTLV